MGFPVKYPINNVFIHCICTLPLTRLVVLCKFNTVSEHISQCLFHYLLSSHYLNVTFLSLMFVLYVECLHW